MAPALAEQLSKYGDTDLQAAIKEQQRLEHQEQEIQEDLSQTRENVARLEEEIETYEQRQIGLETIKGLTEKRERLRDDLRNCEDRIEKTDEDLASTISRDGYLAFCDSVFSKTEELVAAARQRGDLQEKIKPQFVDDLLAEQSCICGRPLPPGSQEEAKLLYWGDGKRYILELLTSKEGADRQIDIDGRSYPYVIADNDPADCTIVCEVREES